jgi:hypothetical protein
MCVCNLEKKMLLKREKSFSGRSSAKMTKEMSVVERKSTVTIKMQKDESK